MIPVFKNVPGGLVGAFRRDNRTAISALHPTLHERQGSQQWSAGIGKQ